MTITVVRDYTATAPSCDGDPMPLRIRLSWTADNPYAVVLAFPSRPQMTPWTFSRELLEQGLTMPAGIGDVRCTSTPDCYTITLLGSGHEDGVSIGLGLRCAWVVDSLAATVSRGDPYGDALDSAIEQLFRDAA
jgi:hypothetical protein